MQATSQPITQGSSQNLTTQEVNMVQPNKILNFDTFSKGEW